MPLQGEARRAFGAAPSTRTTLPEMKAAAGDKRNTTAAEISDSVPSRCRGTARRRYLRFCFTISGYVSRPDETIQPGATALTRIPDGAHSTAAVSVKFTI